MSCVRANESGAATGPSGRLDVQRTVTTAEVVRLDDFGRLSEPHHLSIYPAWAQSGNSIGEPRIYVFPDCEIGGWGFIRRGQAVLAPPDIWPRWFTDRLCLPAPAGGAEDPAKIAAWQARCVGALFDDDARVISLDVPVATVVNPNFIYGHVLLEMLPRLYLLGLARVLGLRFPLALPSTAPDWFHALLRLYVPATEVVSFDPAGERVTAPAVVAPSMMHAAYQFHPAFAAMAADVKARAGVDVVAPPSGRRLYLSRRRFRETGSSWHVVENEQEIEAVLRDEHGFEVLYPEEMSLAEQLGAYHGAAVLAGESGSQMHNSLFASRGAAVVVMNEVNGLQRRICKFMGQPFVVVPPEDGILRTYATHPYDGHFRVDPEAVARALAGLDAAAPSTSTSVRFFRASSG